MRMPAVQTEKKGLKSSILKPEDLQLAQQLLKQQLGICASKDMDMHAPLEEER